MTGALRVKLCRQSLERNVRYAWNIKKKKNAQIVSDIASIFSRLFVILSLKNVDTGMFVKTSRYIFVDFLHFYTPTHDSVEVFCFTLVSVNIFVSGQQLE